PFARSLGALLAASSPKSVKKILGKGRPYLLLKRGAWISDRGVVKVWVLILAIGVGLSFAGKKKQPVKEKEEKEFFRSGKPRRIATYRKNLLHGPTKVFYENGNPKS